MYNQEVILLVYCLRDDMIISYVFGWSLNNLQFVLLIVILLVVSSSF